MKQFIIIATLLIVSSCNIKRESDIDSNFGNNHNSHNPSIQSTNETVNQNTPLTNIVGFAPSNNGGTPVFSVINPPSHGSLTLNPTTGTYTYNPSLNYVGQDQFTWSVLYNGKQYQSNVIINVLDPNGNSNPIANNLNLTLNEDENLIGALLASSPNNNPLTYIIVVQPTKGTVVVNSSTGDFIYVPNPNANGHDLFTYKVNDGSDSNTATVTLTINPVNDAPFAQNDSLQTNESQMLSGQAQATDIDSPVLTYAVVAGSSNGQLTFNADGSFTYLPNPLFIGNDSFSFKANDGHIDSNVATISINVNSVNQAPLANGSNFITPEDTAYNGSLSASDPNGDNLTYIITQQPNKGVLTILNANLGTFSYIPNANENGNDSFSFKVNDGQVDSNIAIVSIVITPVNDAPVANNLAVVVPDSSVSGQVVATDVDSSVLTYSLVSLPNKGTVIFNTDGTFTYTRNHGQTGADSFAYKANDGQLDSNIATVSITINSVNNPPVAQDQSFPLNEDEPLNGQIIATDADNDPLTYTVVNPPVNGVLTLNPDGTFTYTPNPDFNGTDTFIVIVSDPSSSTPNITITLNVAPVNDAPIANNLSINVPVDSVSGQVTATDIDSTTLTFSLVSQPAKGTVLFNSDGAFTYTRNHGETGSDSFIFKANDGELDSNIATVSISIDSVNHPPLAQNQSFPLNEDETLNGQVVATDADGDPLTYTLVNPPTSGQLTLNPDGTFTYTPNPDFNGTDTFIVTVSDPSSSTPNITITLNVNPVNDAPIASNLSVVVPNDSVSGQVIATDIDSANLTYSLVTQPLKGVVVFNNDGSFTYTRNHGQTGLDSFTFKSNDGSLDSNIATVSISIDSVNNPPVAQNQSFNLNEDEMLNGQVVASDEDNDPLTYTLVSNPNNGVLTLNSDGSFTYVPNQDFNGTDTFVVQVSDPSSSAPNITITLNVAPVNDSPTVSDISIVTTKNSPVGSSFSGQDIDGDNLTYSVVSQPQHGSVVVSNGTFTYTPNNNYFGSDSFTYKANDGNLDSNIATVSIEITYVNNAPVANNSSFTTLEDSVLIGNASAVDSDEDTLTYLLVDQASNGTVLLNSFTGEFTYTPNLNYNGTDSFSFKVNDGQTDSNTAVITFTVEAVNDAPVVTAISLSTQKNDPVSANFIGQDVENGALTYIIVSNPSNGSVIINGSSFTYTPNNNFHGNDSFTYKANDGDLDSNIETVSIEVIYFNNAPVVSSASHTVAEDNVLTNTISASDSDEDSLTYSLVGQATNGIVVLNPSTGDFTYTPNADFHGSDSFSVKVNDGQVDSNIASISITVTPVNDAPVANNGNMATNKNNAVAVVLQSNDVDGDNLNYIIVSQPQNGTLSGTGSNLTYTPNHNYFGNDSFTFKTNDGTVDSNTATVSITINNTNDAPIITPFVITMQEDEVKTGTVVATDPDEDSLEFIIVSQPSHGILTLDESTGEYTYTPNLNYNGNDSFVIKVSDGSLESANYEVPITISPVNDLPTTTGFSFAVLQGNTHNGNLIADDVDGDNLTYIVVSNPTKGNLTVNPVTGEFSYTANLLSLGTDSFSFKVNDGNGDSNVSVMNISFIILQLPPVATNSSVSGDEDTVISGTLNATDVNGDVLHFSLVQNAQNGQVIVNSNGSFTYTPNQDFHGMDSFTFKANDAMFDSNTATVSITVNPVNDTPVASDLTASTNEDTAVDITLQGSDVEGSALTYSIVSQPTNGTISLNGNIATYTPNQDYSGSDSFTYKVNDGSLDSNVATVSISVIEINDTPVVQNSLFVLDEDSSLTASVVATDAENNPLTYTVIGSPSNGTVNLSLMTGSFTYTPNLNFNGTDSFSVQVSDGFSLSNIGIITLQVNPINDAPVLVSNSLSLNEGTQYQGILLQGSDVDGDSLTYSVVSSTGNCSIMLDNDQTGHGTVVAPMISTPSETCLLTMKVSDGQLFSNEATLTITVNNVNNLPVAINATFSTDEDETIMGSLIGTDVDGDALNFIAVTQPTKGTLTLNSDGAFVYIPNPNISGSDSFTFKVNDGYGDSNIAEVVINIASVNDAPIAQDLNLSTAEDTAISITLQGTDEESNPLTYTVLTQPQHGILTGSGQNITYTPNLNYNGVDSFTYKVNDGSLDSNTATVSITITPVNDAPVASNYSFSTPKNTQATNKQLPASDVDGDSLTYIIVSNPTKGNLSFNANTGVFSYTPNNNYTGSDSFTFRVNDGTINSNTATVSISVTDPNDIPMAFNAQYQLQEDQQYGGNMQGQDNLGRQLTYHVVNTTTNGTLTAQPNGTFMYVPNPNYFGSDSFTFKVNNGIADSNIATITFNVISVNDYPVAHHQSITVTKNTSYTITLVGSDVETPEANLIYSIVSQPQHGTLTGSGNTRIYTPNNNYLGSDTFSFKVNDGQNDSQNGNVTISVINSGNPGNGNPPANWCDADFLHKQKLVFNNQDSAETLTNFPVLVKLNSSNIDYADFKSNGSDIRFYDDSCTSLNYEIERWNPQGESFIWVKVPTIASNSNASFIWMYYSNPAANHAQNKNGVWDENFKAVYHAEETTGKILADSTSNNNEVKSTGSPVQNVAGKIAGGELFDSNSDFYAETTEKTSLRITNQLSLESWVYITSCSSGDYMIEKRYVQSSSNKIDYGLYMESCSPRFRVGGKTLTVSGSIAKNKWYHIIGTFNTTTNRCTLYVNGLQVATSTSCTDELSGLGGDRLRIANNPSSSKYFNGAIDEIRIHNTARSTAWIKAQYLNMTNGFISYGTKRNQGEEFEHILMTIKSNADDGKIHEYSNNVYPNGHDGITYQGASKGRPVWGWYRFQLPQSIPANAQIKKVMLRLYGRAATSNWGNNFLVIGAENKANATLITNINQKPGGSAGVNTVATGHTWGAGGLTWKLEDWNDSSNFKDVIIDLKNTQGGLVSGNYIQLFLTKAAPYGNKPTPIVDIDVSGNINYFLGLSVDITVPTSPLINVGLNSNLLNSLGLGNLQLCILNLIGLNCNNQPDIELGAEDSSHDSLNHAQLMIEYEE